MALKMELKLSSRAKKFLKPLNMKSFQKAHNNEYNEKLHGFQILYSSLSFNFIFHEVLDVPLSYGKG